jgi:hypothetical protein
LLLLYAVLIAAASLRYWRKIGPGDYAHEEMQ